MWKHLTWYMVHSKSSLSDFPLELPYLIDSKMHILNLNSLKLDILMVWHTWIESGFFSFLVFHKIKVPPRLDTML